MISYKHEAIINYIYFPESISKLRTNKGTLIIRLSYFLNDNIAFCSVCVLVRNKDVLCIH